VRYLLTIFIVLLCHFATSAKKGPLLQQKDSLHRLINGALTDKERALVYMQLSGVLTALGNYDSAHWYASRALQLSQKVRDVNIEIRCFEALANTFGNYGSRDYQQAQALLTEAKELAGKHRLFQDVHRINSAILNIFFYNGDFPEAMKLATEGLAMAEAQKNERLISHYTNLIGFVYLRQDDFTNAKIYYDRYVSFSKQNSDSIRLADALNNLGELFCASKLFDSAVSYHLKALKIYQVLYTQKPRPMYFNPDRMAFTFFRLSWATIQLNQQEVASEFVHKGFQYVEKHTPNEYDLAFYNLVAGVVHRHAGELRKAHEFLLKSMSLSRSIHHREDIRDAYEQLHILHKVFGRFDSAYFYLQLYQAERDSIVNERRNAQIKKIQSEFDLAKRDQQIELLRQQQRVYDLELERQRFLKNALIGLFVVLSLMAYLMYNRYQLRQRNTFHYQLNQKQNELLNTIVSVQDSERKRIAQDLHDGLGSILSTAKLKLSSVDIGSLSLDDLKKYKSSLELLDEAAQELRNVSHNIMPASLSRLGLPSALQNLFENISAFSGLTIDFKAYGFEERIDENTEISLYRVILELINNIVKHARANKATVQLVRHADYINVTVEDNGQGFNFKEAIHTHAGMGLSNIASRLDYLKGKMDVDSAFGRGTTIVIDVPVLS
jgi:signal transduction histidine kinase